MNDLAAQHGDGSTNGHNYENNANAACHQHGIVLIAVHTAQQCKSVDQCRCYSKPCNAAAEIGNSLSVQTQQAEHHAAKYVAYLPSKTGPVNAIDQDNGVSLHEVTQTSSQDNLHNKPHKARYACNFTNNHNKRHSKHQSTTSKRQSNSFKHNLTSALHSNG